MRSIFIAIIVLFTLNTRAADAEMGLFKIDSVRPLPFGLAKKDSLRSDSLAPLVVKDKVKSPRRAALYSALVPGAGQIYNGGWGYVKAPVIWGGFFFLGRGIQKYTRDKNFFLDVLVLKDVDSSSTHIASFIDAHEDKDKVTTLTGTQMASLSSAQLQDEYNQIRSNLQNMYLFSVVWYGLNVLDAVVDAHLKSFDVSDDLSMRIKTGWFQSGYGFQGIRPSVGLSFSLK